MVKTYAIYGAKKIVKRRTKIFFTKSFGSHHFFHIRKNTINLYSLYEGLFLPYTLAISSNSLVVNYTFDESIHLFT